MNDNLNQTDLNNSNELPAQVDPTVELRTSHEAMLKEIRSWGYWALGLGALHIISLGFLDSAWGILLIVVGLASFYYRTAPMFVIYTVTLAWAALSNLASLNLEWMLFALLQFYMAFRTFKDYRRFGKIEDEFAQISNDISTNSQRAKISFPWIGAILSSLAIFGCVAYWVLTFVLVAVLGANSEPPAYYVFLIRLIEIIGVMGFSVSLASLLAKHTPKSLPIIGLIAGGTMIILFLATSIFLAFS